MVAGRDENAERLKTLPYARKVQRPWTRFQLSMVVVCAVALVFVGVSTIELLYQVPGERYLFGQPSDFGYLGLIAAIASPIILVLSFFARKPEVITAAACLVVLAIIWTVRAFVLLSYL